MNKSHENLRSMSSSNILSISGPATSTVETGGLTGTIFHKGFLNVIDAELTARQFETNHLTPALPWSEFQLTAEAFDRGVNDGQPQSAALAVGTRPTEKSVGYLNAIRIGDPRSPIQNGDIESVDRSFKRNADFTAFRRHRDGVFDHVAECGS